MKQKIIDASVNRNKNGQLEIQFRSTNDEAFSLYWTDEPNASTKNKQLLKEGVSHSITIDDPLKAQKRVYFILEDCNKTSFIFAERTLPVIGLNNFRDFGGYLGADGKRVKWGEFYRSNHLYALKPEAESYIRGLGIKTIIDYRCLNEIKNSPNTFIGEKQTLHLDASAQTAELAAQFAADPSDEDRALIESVQKNIPKELINGDGAQVLEQYRNFVLNEKSKLSFSKMLKALVDKNNNPSLQHCRGGKDRTGYGVLLVQAMLGVSEEDIIYDYMLTHKNRLERNEVKMAAYRKITQDENVLAYLLSLIDTREIFVEEILKTMKEVSGSVEQYIKNELGMTEDDFKIMRQNYLE